MISLEYKNKLSEACVLSKHDRGELLTENGMKGHENKLIFGDNLKVLKCLLYDLNLSKSIDLIYIDPPFSTRNTFKIGKTRTSTISFAQSDETAYEDNLIGAEFIEFLRQRLILMRELMSDKASIYLHIDYKIGHYVKIMMDEIFGISNFRNDIARIKCSPKNFSRKGYGNIKDLILFYSKTGKYTWHEPREAFKGDEVRKLFLKVDENGRHYTTIPLHAPGETANGSTGKAWRGILPPKGRHWRSDPAELENLDKAGLVEWSKNNVPRKRIFMEDARERGKRVQDIWEYKDPMYPQYPTEKNIELVRRIITTSSDEDDVVMDCFLGSGTTIMAANELGRRWIGIDNSKPALDTVQKRLKSLSPTLFKSDLRYELLRIKNGSAV